MVLANSANGGINERSWSFMDNFPDFMKRNVNKVPTRQQNTPDIDGYYYTAQDGSQMTFWTCSADRTSKEHTHDYDEYRIYRYNKWNRNHFACR